MGTLSREATAIFVSHLIGINSKKKELAPLRENSFRVNPLLGMSSASGEAKGTPRKTVCLCKNAENMAVYLSPQNFAVMSKFLKHSFLLQMLIGRNWMFIRKEISCTSCIDIFCLVKMYISLLGDDAVFILFMIGVYPSFQNYPNFLNQSCHSYVVHLHGEVLFKNLDLEVSGTQIYFFEIVLEGRTLFYKPKKNGSYKICGMHMFFNPESSERIC